MMEKRDLICIGCPMGCRLEITIEEEKNIVVKGQSCKRGIDYGIKECTNPTRILTTTIEVSGGLTGVVSVKTEKDIPKDKLFDCIKELKNIRINAPVRIGDVIIENILGTGVNIVATSGCEKLCS